MKKIECNECSKAFKLVLKEKKHGQGIKEGYFICPHCKHRYTAYVNDAECRRLQARIGRMHDKRIALAYDAIDGKMTEVEFNRRTDKLNETEQEMKARLQVRMDRLKGMVSK